MNESIQLSKGDARRVNHDLRRIHGQVSDAIIACQGLSAQVPSIADEVSRIGNELGHEAISLTALLHSLGLLARSED